MSYFQNPRAEYKQRYRKVKPQQPYNDDPYGCRISGPRDNAMTPEFIRALKIIKKYV